jgi:hypothetical protein
MRIGDLPRRDLPQSNHDLPVVSRIRQGLGTFEELPGPLSGQQNKGKPIFGLLQRIFYGNSGHMV